MKFLTALTRDLEIAREIEGKPLSLAIKRNDYKSLLIAHNTLAVLCCIEECDTYLEIKEAANRIHNVYMNIEDEIESISIIPFGHLSAIASNDINFIKILLDKLGRSLKNKGLKVATIEPATANIFVGNIVLFDKLNTVRLGTSEQSLKSTLLALIRSFGIKKVFKIIGQIIE